MADTTQRVDIAYEFVGPGLMEFVPAMVELFCDSFTATSSFRCSMPIPIYNAGSGQPVLIILRPGKIPNGAGVLLAIRRCWPKVAVRGDGIMPAMKQWLGVSAIGPATSWGLPVTRPHFGRSQPGPRMSLRPESRSQTRKSAATTPSVTV